jgi:hypothetical protein
MPSDFDVLKAQALALRTQAEAVRSVAPDQAAALTAQAEAIDRQIVAAAQQVGARTREALLLSAADELVGMAAAAVRASAVTLEEVGTLTLADKANAVARLVSPIFRLAVASSAETKMAKLAGVARELDRAYQLMRVRWKLNPELAGPMAEHTPAAEARVEAAYRGLVAESGRVVAAMGTLRVPVTVADMAVSAFFTGLAHQIDKAAGALDAILQSLRNLAEALAKITGTAADYPWLLAGAAVLVGGAILWAKLS